MAAKKTASKKTSSGSRSGKGKDKIEKVMHEYKHHQLRSGGRKKVSNPKQAIAIALSEARESGADIPPRKSGEKKSASRKTGSKKSAAKKAAPKKSAARKTGAKKTGGKTPRKSASKRS
jgi:hypothetical protein